MSRCIRAVVLSVVTALLFSTASDGLFLSSAEHSSSNHNLTIFQVNSERTYKDYSSKNCKLNEPRTKSDSSSLVSTSSAPRHGGHGGDGWSVGRNSLCNPSGGNCQFSDGSYQVIDLTELSCAQGGGKNVGNISLYCNDYSVDGGEGVQVHWLKPKFDKQGKAWPAPFTENCNSTTNRTLCYDLEKPLKTIQCGTGYSPVNCSLPLPDPRDLGGALLMSISGLELPVADCEAGTFNQIILGCSVVFVPA